MSLSLSLPPPPARPLAPLPLARPPALPPSRLACIGCACVGSRARSHHRIIAPLGFFESKRAPRRLGPGWLARALWEEAAPRQLGRPPEVVICAPGLRGGGAANVRRCTLPARAISCASAAFQECALRTFRVFRSPEAARVRVYDRRRYLPSGAPG